MPKVERLSTLDKFIEKNKIFDNDIFLWILKKLKYNKKRYNIILYIIKSN